MADDANVKAWVHAQEGIMKAERSIKVLGRYIQQNPGTAKKWEPQIDALNRRIEQVSADIQTLEGMIDPEKLKELHSELDAVREHERKK